MGYVYDFDIGSVLFFGLTILFYLSKRRLRNLQDSIFTAMLICALIAVVFDLAAAVMETQAERYPVWLLYAVNMLFIAGMQTCLPLFFLYAVASAGKFNRFSTAERIISAIPYLITISLLLLSPWIPFGICRIDSAHIYRPGPTHAALYLNTGVYVLIGVAVLLRNGRSIPKAKRNVILLFVVLLFFSIIMQQLFPRYLLTASATALSLTSVFYVLQSPVDQVDPLTGAFSRTLLPSLLEDYVERGRSYTLLLISLRSFDAFVRLYGNDAGDALLSAYAKALMARFSGDTVVFMDTSEFVIVRDERLCLPEVLRLRGEIPETATVGGYGSVHVDACLGAVPCHEGESAASDLSTVDYMLREMRSADSDAVPYADAAYRHNCMTALRLEMSLDSLLGGEGVSLSLRPIRDRDGAIAAEEAQLVASGEMAQHVSPRQFLQAIGQGGHTQAYYRTLLSRLADRRTLYSADKRVCLPLLFSALLPEDAPERMQALAVSMGFAPEQILLSVKESEIAASIPVVAENLRKLAGIGFAFLLDDFAEDYTDLPGVASLPFRFARIHDSFIQNAARSPHDAKLLVGLLNVLNDIGIVPVCPGIDGCAERKAALDAGAVLLQGTWTEAGAPKPGTPA